MAEYIERESLKQYLLGKGFYPAIVKGALKSLPAADVVEVRHGEWLEHIEKPEWLDDDVEIYYECSVCGCNNFGKSPYCPSCGADMRGEKNGKE